MHLITREEKSMNQLKVVSIDGQLVTESREVAKMIGQQHKELLRSIRGYNEVLTSADLRSENFFIESTYKNIRNQEFPCYLLTKQGCEMVANKMTGEKGILFTAAYVTKFNEMEKQPRVLTTKEQITASMKLSIEANETLEQQDKRITNLEENMRIDGVQEHKLNKLGKRVVVKSLGGYESPAYKEMSGKVFARFWRDFKNHFMIPRYGELPRVQFDDGINFIEIWQPDTSTRLEIDLLNRQQVIKEVI